jgi:hypothetical protein
MKLRWSILALPALALLAPARPAPACSLCGAALKQAPTFRQEAALPSARLILYGTAKNPRLKSDGTGVTELHVKAVLRDDPARRKRTVLELPRYLPVSDPKSPPQYILFCDVSGENLDPYRGVPVKSASAAEYLRKALTLGEKDPAGNLRFYFRHLDDPDPEVSRDAFLEFAKSTDTQIAQVAPKLDPEKLRTWLKDAKTPPERLGVYALLLGACGKDADAALFRSLLGSKEERYLNAYDGLLAGYIHLRPREGWALAFATLRDGRKHLTARLGVLRTLRYYHGTQPRESRANVLKGMEAALAQGELADLAVEDLRRWEVWDLTREVLNLYGRKGYDGPLMRRALVRYALSCKPTRESADFLAKRRADEPDLVQEVEEGLKLEREN